MNLGPYALGMDDAPSKLESIVAQQTKNGLQLARGTMTGLMSGPGH